MKKMISLVLVILVLGTMLAMALILPLASEEELPLSTWDFAPTETATQFHIVFGTMDPNVPTPDLKIIQIEVPSMGTLIPTP